MTRLELLLREYTLGYHTPTGAAVEALSLVSEETVGAVMNALPPEVMSKLRQFVLDYHPAIRLFNAPMPSERSLQLTKQWFLHHPPSGT